MAAHGGRRTALAALAAGVAALGVAGILSRGVLLEEWHLFRLRSDDEAVRRRAAERLGDLRSARAVPRLIELALREGAGDGVVGGWPYLRVEDEVILEVILEGININSTLSDAKVTFAPPYAEAALIKIGGRAVKGLVALLREPGRREKALALSLLQQIGPEAAAAAPALVAALREKPEELDDAVRRTLVAIDRGAAPAVLDAMAEYEHPGEFQRLHFLLKEIAPELDDRQIAAKVLPALLRALEDGDLPRRLGAIGVLGGLGPAAGAAVPGLLKLLEKGDPEAALPAASALGRIGPPAVAGLLDLLRRRPERDPTATFAALIGLEREHGGVLPELIEGLADPDPLFAASAASLIGAFAASGIEARAALPALEEARKRDSAVLRRALAQALRALRAAEEG